MIFPLWSNERKKEQYEKKKKSYPTQRMALYLPLRIVFKIRVIRSIDKEIRLSCQMNLLNWFSENI